jgi:hypothetical protein
MLCLECKIPHIIITVQISSDYHSTALIACQYISKNDNDLMKYYIWMDREDRPLSKAWRYDDETERIAAEQRPPAADAMLRAGTRIQLMENFGLKNEDFADV